jgi:hypothetical protein
VAPTRTITLYRDDSTTQVVYEDVKHTFWTADNTVFVLAQYTDKATGAHRYIHWPRERPRERFCWFKDVPDA